MGGGAGCVVPAGSSAARGGAVEWISEWEACLAKQVCFCICSLFFRRPFASVASGFAACPAGGGRREPPGRGRRRRRRGADGDANLWGGLLGFVLSFAYWACLVVARNEQRLSVFSPSVVGVQIDYDVMHLWTSLVQLFVLLQLSKLILKK
jgi:hypothetical protein